MHEEFCEAIIRLYEEKQGISQDQRDFRLPEPHEWEDQAWTDDSWAWWTWEEGDEAEGGEDNEAAPAATPSPGDEGPGPEARGSTSPGARQGATGSSPRLRRRQILRSPQTIDELTIADSFIMSVLRGWRLLQASGLSPDEMRDILSATRNSLDYDMIAAALQNLWDDQLLNSRNRHKSGYHMNFVNETEDSELYMAIGGTTALRTMPATMRIHGGMAMKTGLATRPRARPKLLHPLNPLMKGNFVKLSRQNRWQNPSTWKPNGLGQRLNEPQQP